MIGSILGVIFGEGRKAVRETVEIFRPNAEADAVRAATREAAALAQFAAEFAQPRRGWFDRFVDGLNRLPRPLLAFGTLGLFVTALVDPIWFAARMQGIALVPEPMWWLMGAVVSFYFGARHQVKSQEYERGLAEVLARTPSVLRNIRQIEALASNGDQRVAANGVEDADLEHPDTDFAPNAALDDWRRSRGQ